VSNNGARTPFGEGKMFATYFASVKKRWNAKCWFAGRRLVSHTQESESRPVWGNTFLECLRRPQQHVESCDKPPLLLPSPRIGPKQNVCDMFCISEKKMERVVHGEAPGSSPRSGGRMFATYFVSVKKRWTAACTVRCLEAAPLWGQNVCDIFCISEKSSFTQVLDCKWMALVSVSRFSREQNRTFVLATKY